MREDNKELPELKDYPDGILRTMQVTGHSEHVVLIKNLISSYMKINALNAHVRAQAERIHSLEETRRKERLTMSAPDVALPGLLKDAIEFRERLDALEREVKEHLKLIYHPSFKERLEKGEYNQRPAGPEKSCETCRDKETSTYMEPCLTCDADRLDKWTPKPAHGVERGDIPKCPEPITEPVRSCETCGWFDNQKNRCNRIDTTYYTKEGPCICRNKWLPKPAPATNISSAHSSAATLTGYFTCPNCGRVVRVGIPCGCADKKDKASEDKCATCPQDEADRTPSLACKGCEGASEGPKERDAALLKVAIDRKACPGAGWAELLVHVPDARGQVHPLWVNPADLVMEKPNLIDAEKAYFEFGQDGYDAGLKAGRAEAQKELDEAGDLMEKMINELDRLGFRGLDEFIARHSAKRGKGEK